MPPPLIIDLSAIDLNRVLVDLEGIRQVNPQRHEMEQLTAIVHIDTERRETVGYKDVGPNEFWIRGHMPGFPLMPGVIMCEAAAQLASYYCQRYDMLGGEMVGFGGMEGVRFRGLVRPGDRLVIAAQGKLFRRNRRAIFDFQEFVGNTMVCQGQVIGVPL